MTLQDANPVPTTTAGRTVAPNAGRLVALLAVANLLNFYDRAIPTIVADNIKAEFALTDTQLGFLMSGFTLVYAVAGIVLGRLADRRSRRVIMAVGLIVWSVLTAASGGAWSFASLLVFRLGVGVGEASYAPAANATVFDLYPEEKRSGATAMLQIGLPVGLLLAFFTTGPIVEAVDSWRAPFLIAAVPGLVVALIMLKMPFPERVHGPENVVESGETPSPWSLLRIPTMWWLILSGIGGQIVSYSIASFVVPLLQRYFDLGLSAAGIGAGMVMGVAGLVGLLVAGPIANRARRVSSARRLLVGGVGVTLAVPLVWIAFQLSPGDAVLFIALLSVASVLTNALAPVTLPAISEVVHAKLRATSVAVYFAAIYLLGGAFGPIITGAMSEHFQDTAVASDGLSIEAIGLHTSMMWLLPIAFVVSAIGVFGATTTVERDRRKALEEQGTI